MQCYRKSELARMAGVSYSSFYRFLNSHRESLSALGAKPHAQTLRGKALLYVCQEYDIELTDEQPFRHQKFR